MTKGDEDEIDNEATPGEDGGASQQGGGTGGQGGGRGLGSEVALGAVETGATNRSKHVDSIKVKVSEY